MARLHQRHAAAPASPSIGHICRAHINKKIYKLYAQTLDTPSFIGRPLDDWYNVDEDKDDDEPTAPPTRMKARRCRIDWTGAELHQLATWVYDYEASHGIDATKNWGDCLTAMQATGVFDANHLTKIKLREAWRREVTKHKHK